MIGVHFARGAGAAPVIYFANRPSDRHNTYMSLATVAIVGRPNVGKSSLLNALAGRRIAIVDPTPGVTRDRISVTCALGDEGEAGSYVELVDTGGIGIDDSDNLTEHVEDQISYALAEAALIVFLVDAREGVTTLDKVVATKLRKLNRPTILVANKIDTLNMPSEASEFIKLGFGLPLNISAMHTLGLDKLIDTMRESLGDAAGDEPAEAVMKLAIVGKRNAGKSTFINNLVGEDRVIVSETPGTTRDSVDVRLELDGRAITLIDTAGVRKRRKIASDIEYYSTHRALRSIRRADVVALMIDASTPVSSVDKALAGHIADEFKPVLLVVNKWDLAQGKAEGEDYADYFVKMFPQFSYAPISLTTATEGTNVPETLELAEQIFQQANHRVSTGQLNATIEEIVTLRGPSHKAGTKPPKILYATQISTGPPTIICFVNDARSFDTGYQRFLVNQFRERLPFTEVPIRVMFRSRHENAKPRRG